MTEKEFAELLGQYQDEGLRKRLAEEALRIRRLYYGNDVYIRGLIEFTNICKNNCLYCGIPERKPACVKIPPDRRGDSLLLRKGIRPGIPDLCAAGR